MAKHDLLAKVRQAEGKVELSRGMRCSGDGDDDTTGRRCCWAPPYNIPLLSLDAYLRLHHIHIMHSSLAACSTCEKEEIKTEGKKQGKARSSRERERERERKRERVSKSIPGAAFAHRRLRETFSGKRFAEGEDGVGESGCLRRGRENAGRDIGCRGSEEL
jgi:hypothetical protein